MTFGESRLNTFSESWFNELIDPTKLSPTPLSLLNEASSSEPSFFNPAASSLALEFWVNLCKPLFYQLEGWDKNHNPFGDQMIQNSVPVDGAHVKAALDKFNSWI